MFARPLSIRKIARPAVRHFEGGIRRRVIALALAVCRVNNLRVLGQECRNICSMDMLSLRIRSKEAHDNTGSCLTQVLRMIMLVSSRTKNMSIDLFFLM